MSGLTEVLFMERCLRLLKKADAWVWFCLKVFLIHPTFKKFVSILKVRLIKALIAGAEKELRDLKKNYR